MPLVLVVPLLRLVARLVVPLLLLLLLVSPPCAALVAPSVIPTITAARLGGSLRSTASTSAEGSTSAPT